MPVVPHLQRGTSRPRGRGGLVLGVGRLLASPAHDFGRDNPDAANRDHDLKYFDDRIPPEITGPLDSVPFV